MATFTEGFLCARHRARHLQALTHLVLTSTTNPRGWGLLGLFCLLAFIFSYSHFKDEDSKALQSVDVANLPEEVKPAG